MTLVHTGRRKRCQGHALSAKTTGTLKPIHCRLFGFKPRSANTFHCGSPNQSSRLAKCFGRGNPALAFITVVDLEGRPVTSYGLERPDESDFHNFVGDMACYRANEIIFINSKQTEMHMLKAPTATLKSTTAIAIPACAATLGRT